MVVSEFSILAITSLSVFITSTRSGSSETTPSETMYPSKDAKLSVIAVGIFMFLLDFLVAALVNSGSSSLGSLTSLPNSPSPILFSNECELVSLSRRT